MFVRVRLFVLSVLTVLVTAAGVQAQSKPLFFGIMGVDVDPVVAAWGGWRNGVSIYSNPFILSSPVTVTGLTSTDLGDFAPMIETSGFVAFHIGLIKNNVGEIASIDAPSGDLPSPIVLDPGQYTVYTQLNAGFTGPAQYRTRYGNAGIKADPAVSVAPFPLYGANVLISVPEPGTLSLLAVGGLGLLRRRRRA